MMIKYPYILLSICFIYGCSSIESKKEISKNNTSINTTNIQPNGGIQLNRVFLNKDIKFTIDPTIEAGMSNVVWENKFGNDNQYTNQIIQLAPHILQYNQYIENSTIQNYGNTLPMSIEILDSAFHTEKIVKIWDPFPFKAESDIPFSYFNFNEEEMTIIPNELGKNIIPLEYSIFPIIEVIGNHILLGFKKLGINNDRIVSFTSVYRIYKSNGDYLATVDNIPLLDRIIVSPNGLFAMFMFGGQCATVNQPFASIGQKGWGLYDIKANKILLTEFEKEGTHLDGIFYTQHFLHANSTTPLDKAHHDYDVFFDEENQTIYTKYWLQEDWNLLKKEVKATKIRDWKYYFEKYNFETRQVN